MITVRTKAEAYALAWTSGTGEESWKKIESGKVATGSSKELGTLSV